jgi:predicted transcriptional regulator
MISKILLPAVRISIAEELKNRYGYNQSRIAEGLGVAQGAVSKYLNGHYSKETEALKNVIVENKMNSEVLRSIIEKKSHAEVAIGIDRLCADSFLLSLAHKS